MASITESLRNIWKIEDLRSRGPITELIPDVDAIVTHVVPLVQPGDIIYYGNFGPHVAIYVGGGSIIHATSPAPGGHTRIDSLYGYDTPWSAHRVSG